MNLVSDFYRDREPLRALVRELAGESDGVCLDVGCKHGDISRSLAKTKTCLVALDIEAHKEWSEPAERLSFLRADAIALPFADRHFDSAVSSECLQYVSDPEQALAELARVVKPGGSVVVSFPEGHLLTTYLDPYNLAFLLLRMFCPRAVAGESFVHHLRAERLLKSARGRLDCELHLQRGSILFIHLACLADQVQGLRCRLLRRGGLLGRLGDLCLRPAVKLLLWGMSTDFRLAPPLLRYNNILRFRRPAES